MWPSLDRDHCSRTTKAETRGQPPPRLSAPLAPRRREVVIGVPPAQAAITEPGLPVEIQPLECMAPGAARRVDGVVHLLVTPVHQEPPSSPRSIDSPWCPSLNFGERERRSMGTRDYPPTIYICALNIRRGTSLGRSY